MEVHHHSALPHQKKKFTEYFLEFLMIFLAVTLGFFAENIRENISDKEKERNYVESMVADLKRDTANFRLTISHGKATMYTTDSLITLLGAKNRDSFTPVLYKLARKVTVKTDPFTIFDRTYSQMKSSGNLRLLRSGEIADSITGYYFDNNFLISQQNFINGFLEDYMRDVSAVFNPAVFQKMFVSAGLTPEYRFNPHDFIEMTPPATSPPLVDEGSKAINTLVGICHYLYARELNVINIVENENEKALQLIQFLQREYDLKD